MCGSRPFLNSVINVVNVCCVWSQWLAQWINIKEILGLSLVSVIRKKTPIGQEYNKLSK
jgi:hypothetical protein